MDIGTKPKAVRVRYDSLILMTIFAVTSFALMWTAVSCFHRIRYAYENSSECLGAARFTANHLRSAEESISIFTGENGLLDKIVIGRQDGYDDVITLKDGFLWEAVVPGGSDVSLGESIFSADKVYICEASGDTVKITACSGTGQSVIIFAKPSAETKFFSSEGGYDA
ncbi:hypothetical protein [Huintestinicola sp.]|uniref:hypothetical protein n=1 Tax=Huintestinicola sp. TaxID=2981661 RepID=UPI003D7DA7C6